MYASFFVKHHLIGKNCIVFGVGGTNLKKLGVHLFFDYASLKTFGFTSAIFSSFRNYNIYRKICSKIYSIKPEIFVAVAYPGLNLLLSRYAKNLGAKVIYLLPPQIWIWGTFRKYFIRKWVDLVISVFPFEHQFYTHQGIRTAYCPNPLLDELKRYKRNDFEKRIGFMPGSRLSEIKRNLPIVLEIIRKLRAGIKHRFMNIDFCLILHTDSESDMALVNSDSAMKFKCINLQLITKDRYQHMVNCDLIITCSGTASLETAIMQIPQIFFNKPGFFDYHIFRHFLNIKEYNLANLFFGNKIAPSFVMRTNNKIIENIAKIALEYLENPNHMYSPELSEIVTTKLAQEEQ